MRFTWHLVARSGHRSAPRQSNTSPRTGGSTSRLHRKGSLELSFHEHTVVRKWKHKPRPSRCPVKSQYRFSALIPPRKPEVWGDGKAQGCAIALTSTTEQHDQSNVGYHFACCVPYSNCGCTKWQVRFACRSDSILYRARKPRFIRRQGNHGQLSYGT